MFRKTLELKVLSCRLSDTATELKNHCVLLRNRDTTEKDKKLFIANVQTIIQPFLNASSSTVFKAAALLSPIPGSAYVHNNDELKRKREHNTRIDRISNTMKGNITGKTSKEENASPCKKITKPNGDTNNLGPIALPQRR